MDLNFSETEHADTQRHSGSELSSSILLENRSLLIIYFQVSSSNKGFDVDICAWIRVCMYRIFITMHQLGNEYRTRFLSKK
jgi:hypothetical protein